MKMMSKRILVLLTVIVLAVAVMGMTAFAADPDPVDEPVCYEHGDVNSDGSITGDDAVYLLFASFGDMFGDEYQLTQNGDLDGDGEVTGEDAVYLLFASFGDMFGDQYPLNGTIHSYYDPIWTWDTEAAEPTVQVSLKCACGENHTITEDITVTAGTVTDPTCVATGSKEYTASVVFEEKTYENTITVTVSALGEDGHSLDGEPTCEEGVQCQNCDYTIAALGHSYVDNGEKVEGCKHTKLYKCACGKETQGDVYYTHSYTATLLEEATCTKAGKKLLTCACGDTQEETVPLNPEFHVWGEAVTESGVTTQSCACGQTKTIVVMSDSGVSADALKDSEVQLDGGASVALDGDTADQLDSEKTVVIKVEQVDKDETGMSEDEKAQVGNNAIYDFSMEYSDGTPINSFAGEVTVALPYTLQDGDDVNAIDVWYIADDGSVECVKGVYSNGYVTFKTNHFSYYTVTRLTPEQRCAVYGHSMVERTKDATCTEDGYHKVFCQRCGLEEKNEVKTMLGHDYQKDAQLSKDATCDAPGKLATQCSHCGLKRLQEVKQLSHKWDIETVEATCSANGYDKRTCSLCGAEKIENEKEALGHNYSKDSAVWTWTEDHGKATVTLTCTNDETHTKELNAVVTYKGGNACVGGQVTYTATASLNKTVYTTDTTGEIDGIGHTPNTEWASNDENHYHTCSVCGEPVGEAAHDWNRKVITAATCGKDGSATDTCSVCGKEKAVVLTATGNHTFKNGTCTACGYVEGSCDHAKLTTVEIDLSEYGVCGGVAYIRTCECGQVKNWYGCDLVCDLKDEEEVVNEDQSYVKYASYCPDCGFRISAIQKRVLDQENCCGYWTVEYSLAINNAVIVETYDESEITYHPLVVKHDPVNLADYGLCEAVLTNNTCYCGLRSDWDGELGCDMDMNDDGSSFTCPDCGATGTYTQKESKDGCQYLVEAVITINKNGSQVFTATQRAIYTEHAYRVDDYELQGETCADGLTLYRTCSDCGTTTEEFYRSCETFLEDRVIETAGSCTPGIRITTCPCGQAKDWDYVYDDDRTDHNWNHQYIPSVDHWADVCEECGFYLTSESGEIDPSAKDENCIVTYDVNYTYSNINSDVSYSWQITRNTIEHNYMYSFELLGENCEDGVDVTRTCSDCGENDSWTSYYHETYTVETLDLSQYDFCSNKVYLESCACGQNGYIHDDGNCNWEGISVDEGFEESRCTQCGIVQQIRWKDIECDEPCVYLKEYEHTYLKDGETLGVLVYVNRDERHRYVYELNLKEGSETCSDGCDVNGVCLDCGMTDTYTSYSCERYILNREIVSTDDMCGQMEKVTEGCACGRYLSEDVYWRDNERCYFHIDGEYNEEYDGWQYFCECGASRIQYTDELPVEGETCKVEVRHVVYYFAPNGELIAQTSNSEFNDSHDYLYRFEPMGDTCEDGWTYSLCCVDCGDTYNADEEVYYDHNTHPISRELVYDSEDICAPIYCYHESCSCGKNNNYSINFACNSNWDEDVYTCKHCGLQYMYDSDSVRRPGTCTEDVSIEYTFLRDNQTGATVSKEYTAIDHVTVYQLILLGDTCEDGYRLLECCAFCNYEDMHSTTYYGHSRHCIEYYDAPEGSCGGEVAVYGCACGKERKVYDQLNCRMHGQRTYETDENGIEHTLWTGECDDCGMTADEDSYTAPGADDCHLVEHTNYGFYFDELTLKLSAQTTNTNHSWKVTGAEYINEDSTDCSEGVELAVCCVKCEEQQSWTVYDHRTFADDTKTIDLADYGSVCGAKLEVVSCLCGRECDIVFSEDTQCDVGDNWTELWIEDAVDEEYFTTHGWFYADSYAREYVCAVTDPACGLRIRMACYWLKENCTAVQYETWQLGYEPETGNCLKEITIPTGTVWTFHAYEEMPIVEGTEDGLTTQKESRICADCGSEHFEKYYRDENGNIVKHIRGAINTLDNGDNKQLTRTWEYEYLPSLDGGSVEFTKLYREEFVYATGSTYWEQLEYTIDVSNNCKVTTTYSDSNGGSDTYYSEDDHHTGYSSEWLKRPTCTQSGLLVYRHTCRLCGKITYEHTTEERPNNHSWYYSADKQAYVCSVCGLESKNGVSGSIWMEDLSDDTSYIVGYYRNDDIIFNPYVSLILYDVAEGENDELVLDSITVNYLTVENGGICGLSFSKTATAEAAAAALKAAGYTGRYAVRISCVPVGGNHTLDYAVTFDTLTAE